MLRTQSLKKKHAPIHPTNKHDRGTSWKLFFFGLASGDMGSGTMKFSSTKMSLMGAVRCKANYFCPKMSSNDHNPLNNQLFYLELPFHAFPLQP